MTNTIDKEVFNKILDERAVVLRSEALEIGNRINVLKSETVQLEAVQKEVIGRLKEIDVTRETFTKKSKPSTEVPKK